MNLPICFAMQPNTGRSGTEKGESEHRKEGREEVLPNFVSRRTDERRAGRDEQDSTQCAGDTNVSTLRDGDEYLIIDSSENADEDSLKIDREPAIRHAVVQDEQLWKIPDNWTRYLRVQNDDAPDQLLYEIPEPMVNVVVRVPREGGTDKPRYQVEKVGGVEVKLIEEPNRHAFRRLISTVEEEDDESEEVLTALRTLENQWHNFERDYISHMNKYGGEATWGLFKVEGGTAVKSWSVNPWDTDQNIAHFLPTRDLDDDVLGQVTGRLINAGVVSPSPVFKIRLKDGEQLPPAYFIQALAEAGCSPAEIVDWMMVKTRGHSQSTWSDVRDEHDPQVAENIRAAHRTLTS
jgi:hypothetical protein